MRTWQDIFAVKLAEMHLTELWTLQEDDTLQVQACRPDWEEFVQRRALGRFLCSQCFHKWSLAKVHILFHMCRCRGWGMVLMRIFRQECRHCLKPRLEDPEFSLETIERILHNLVVKILQYFYNEPVQPSDLVEVVVEKPVAGPHNRAHCEACQLGICNKSLLAPALDAWKPLTDADKDSIHHIESWLPLASDTWKSLLDEGKDRTRCTKSKPTLARDAWKPLKGVGKARTHRSKSQAALSQVADADKSRTFQTLKRQDLRPHATLTQPLSLSDSSFPWKRCCCISSSLLCVLAVIIFVVLYFTIG